MLLKCCHVLKVAMWSEQVSGVAVESKLWPRGSALGERLWADPDSDWKAAEVFFTQFLKPWNLTRIGTDPDIFAGTLFSPTRTFSGQRYSGRCSPTGVVLPKRRVVLLEKVKLTYFNKRPKLQSNAYLFRCRGTTREIYTMRQLITARKEICSGAQLSIG